MNSLDIYPQENTCPICGEEVNITYNSNGIDEAGFSYSCECDKCGTKWNECYDLVFAGNFGIIDKDGNSYCDLYT